MAFDPKPSSWIASWSEDGTDVTFPLASVNNLSAAIADATTGDWRTCLIYILEHTYAYYMSLGSSDRPANVVPRVEMYMSESGDIYRTISFTSKITGITMGETFAPDPES